MLPAARTAQAKFTFGHRESRYAGRAPPRLYCQIASVRGSPDFEIRVAGILWQVETGLARSGRRDARQIFEGRRTRRRKASGREGRNPAAWRRKKPTQRRRLESAGWMAERTGLEPATSGVTGQHSNQLNYRSAFLKLPKTTVRLESARIPNPRIKFKTYGQSLDLPGVPKGIRTPVAAVKGRCPGPLDDGDASQKPGGASRDRTGDLYNAIVALSQLSYGPERGAEG